MNNGTPDVNSLFAQAHGYGELSDEAYQALSVGDLGAQIQAAMGVPALNVPASRGVLLTMLIDDSGSIQYKGNEQAVRDGYNEIVGAMKESRQADETLATTRYLNGRVLYPYQFLAHVPLLDKHNYQANGGTPLYDQAIGILGTVLAKTLEFARNGTPVSTVTLIVTDGNDEGSTNTARQVYPIVTDMLAQECHIVAGMGIDDGSTDFRRVFRDMGIHDNWILTPRNDPKEIRRAFQMFSQSAIRASSSGVHFSATAQSGLSMGGFNV
ncbi:MAG: hypothetical protein WCD37_00555 [Chloroflexia bacterium]